MDKERSQYRSVVLRVGYCSFAILAIRVLLLGLAATYTNSSSVYLNLWDAGCDLGISVLMQCILTLACRPICQAFSYGLGKAEYFFAILQASVLFAGAFQAIKQISFTSSASALASTSIGLHFLLCAVLVMGCLYLIQWRAYQKTRSPAIFAAWKNNASDLLVNITTFIGLCVATCCPGWLGWTDGALAIGIAAYMCYHAFYVLKEAIEELCDKSLPAEELSLIQATANSIPLLANHNATLNVVRSRKVGVTRFVELALTDFPDALAIRDLASSLKNLQAHLNHQFPIDITVTL